MLSYFGSIDKHSTPKKGGGGGIPFKDRLYSSEFAPQVQTLFLRSRLLLAWEVCLFVLC